MTRAALRMDDGFRKEVLTFTKFLQVDRQSDDFMTALLASLSVDARNFTCFGRFSPKHLGF